MNELRGFKFVITLVLKLRKRTTKKDGTKYSTFYLNSKAETIIHNINNDGIFESIYSTIMRKIQKYQEVGSGWTIYSVIEQNINVSKNKLLSGSCYTKLPKELNHSRQGLVNIQNSDDNEFLKWCLVRYLNPADYHPVRIRKIDKNFLRKLDFKSIKFPVKLEILKK